ADPSLTKPSTADIFYQAGVGALEMALRHQVDVVLVVSAMFMHPDVLILMKQAGLRVTVLFTESPYDHEKELIVAGLVDGIWTNERSSVPAFRAVTASAGYLPHGWHPEKHGPNIAGPDMPAHDVVFVGTGFHERAQWFNAIDWTGIDLGLYGNWKGAGLSKKLRGCVKGGYIDNVEASALYRKAKIGLNLYRQSKGWGRQAVRIDHAESLNPRAYELAACGTFHLSDPRQEVVEVFGEKVPTFRTPVEAAALIRTWLADDAGRASIAASLPACVAEASWIDRATTVLGDLQTLCRQAA
ncbi:MAG: glycosyltransferase, partial [Gemmatimonadota bacterium]